MIVQVPKKYIQIFNTVDKCFWMTEEEKTKLKQDIAANKELSGTRKRRRETIRELNKMIYARGKIKRTEENNPK